MKCNSTQKRTVYELSAIQKRWSSSKKSVFLEKSVQKLFNKKIKTDFYQKSTFFYCRLLRNSSFLRKVTFHMVNVKRVVLYLLFKSYYRIWRLRFLIRRQSRPAFFCKRGSSLFSNKMRSNAKKTFSNPLPSRDRGVKGLVIHLMGIVMFTIYLIWLIVPDSYLAYAGVTFLPQKYWAVAIPIYLAVMFIFFLAFVYPSIGLYNTVPLQEGDMRYIVDSHTIYNEDSFGSEPNENGRIATLCDMYPEKVIENLTRKRRSSWLILHVVLYIYTTLQCLTCKKGRATT